MTRPITRAAPPPDPSRPLPAGRFWYCIRTLPAKEAQVGWWLEGAGHHALVPLESRWKLPKGSPRGGKVRPKRTRYQVPLIPRIVIAGIRGFPQWLDILALPGVAGVIGSKGEPVPLRPGEAERIQTSSEAVRRAPEGREHKVGEMVRLVIPVAGMDGRVVEIAKLDGAEAQLKGLFAWASRVTIAVDSLEAAG